MLFRRTLLVIAPAVLLLTNCSDPNNSREMTVVQERLVVAGKCKEDHVLTGETYAGRIFVRVKPKARLISIKGELERCFEPPLPGPEPNNRPYIAPQIMRLKGLKRADIRAEYFTARAVSEHYPNEDDIDLPEDADFQTPFVKYNSSCELQVVIRRPGEVAEDAAEQRHPCQYANVASAKKSGSQ